MTSLALLYWLFAPVPLLWFAAMLIIISEIEND